MLSVQLLVVLLLVALLAGQALGQPILLSFVETGSMEPTLEPGDGFVAIPAELAGEPQQGDVITFNAQELHGGGLTTHRVVDETDRGYITHGDANPATDQDGSEPPVQKAQIVAKAWQVNGNVVVIPHLGTAAMGLQSGVESLQHGLARMFGTSALLGTQGLAYLLAALSGIVYAVDLWLTRGPKRTVDDREFSRSRDTGVSMRLVVVGCVGLVLLSATAAMVAPAGTTEYGVVSAQFDSDRPTVIPSGETETVDYAVLNAGIIPTYVHLEGASEGATVEPDSLLVERRSQANATVSLTAPPETGYYPMYVQEYRYLAVLPGPVIADLYEIHPWVPIVAINAMLGIPIYLLGTVLLGRGSIRDRRWKRTGGGWSRSS